METADCVVIGAGVIGLAVARALALAGREVIVLEAEDCIGSGISSRNSEVIHAGIYYPAGSLKARFCVAGREQLYAYCIERGVAFDRCGKLIVATEQHDEAGVMRATTALEDYLEHRGVQVNSIMAMSTERAEGEAFFGAIIFLLLVMALMLAIVGGLGLMGTMSINVLERTREIGVLRAIGAPNKGVARVFIREGIAIGLISWLFGAMLAYPLGKGLSDAVGLAVMGIPLNFSYSIIGLWVWLVPVVILSAVASFIPARNASRLTVREVLAYE